MLRWLTVNLRIFLLAFVLAVAVWVSAVTASDPDESRLYPYSIPIELIGQDPSLVIIDNLPTSVQVNLRAPRSVWEKLTSQEDAIRAVADLTGLDAGTHQVTIQIQIEIRPVRILSVTPATLNFSLEPLASRAFPIELTLVGEPAVGYLAGGATLQPVEVVVSGPESLMERVAGVRAILDLTGARQNMESDLPIHAMDEDDQALAGLTLNPNEVNVSLPVEQQGGYRDLAVKVIVKGRVASGYQLTGISVFPAVVTVFSQDPEFVNTLPGFVETKPLDLTDANTNIETRLELTLPEGITLVGEQTVMVQVEITAIEGSVTLAGRPVEVINLQPDLQARLSPEKVDVILSGPLPVLDILQASDVRVVVDVKDLAVGTYQLKPVVEIQINGIVVESLLPETVEVTITNAATPTPQ